MLLRSSASLHNDGRSKHGFTAHSDTADSRPNAVHVNVLREIDADGLPLESFQVRYYNHIKYAGANSRKCKSGTDFATSGTMIGDGTETSKVDLTSTV